MREIASSGLSWSARERYEGTAGRRAALRLAAKKSASSAVLAATTSDSTSQPHVAPLRLARSPEASPGSSWTSDSAAARLKSSLVSHEPLTSTRPPAPIGIRESPPLTNSSCPSDKRTMDCRPSEGLKLAVMRPQTWSLEARRGRTVTNSSRELISEPSCSSAATRMRSEVSRKGTPSILPRLLTKKQASGGGGANTAVLDSPESQEVSDSRVLNKISAPADGQRQVDALDAVPASKQELPCGRPNRLAGGTGAPARVRASKSDGRLSNSAAIVHGQQQQRDLLVRKKVVSKQQAKLGTGRISGNQVASAKGDSANLDVNSEGATRECEPEHSGRATSIRGHLNGLKTSAATRDTCENGSTNSGHELARSAGSKHAGRPPGDSSGGHGASAGASMSKQEQDGTRGCEAELSGAVGEKKRALSRTSKTSGQERMSASELRASYCATSATGRRLAFAGRASALAAPSSSLSPAGNKSARSVKSASSAGKNDHSRPNEKQAASEPQARPNNDTCLISGQTGRRPGSSGAPLSRAPQQRQQAKSTNCYTAHQRPDRNINLQPQQVGQDKSMRRPACVAGRASGCARKATALLPAAHKTNETISHASESAAAINDRLLPKPMGQQVLGLMMLDAGLLPAGGQAGTTSKGNKSHVCLQGGHSSSSLAAEFAHSDCPSVASLSRQLADSLRKLSARDVELDGNNNAPADLRPCTRIDFSTTSFEDASGRFHSQTGSVSLPTSPRPTRPAGARGSPLAREQPRVGMLGEVQSAARRASGLAGWLSPARFKRDQWREARGAALWTPEVNPELGTPSIGSSSCSSLNHHCLPPPPLALSNQLSDFAFHQLLNAAGDLDASRAPKASQRKLADDEFESEGVHLTDWIASPSASQLAKSDEEAENIDECRHNGDPISSSQTDSIRASGFRHKMDHVVGRRELFATLAAPTSLADSHNQQTPACGSRDTRPSPSMSRAAVPDAEQWEQIRHQQPRSNSIGEHEFGSAGHQRLKQSIYPHQSPYIDANQYYGQRLRETGQPSGLDRSLSPMNFESGQDCQLAQRSNSIKYASDRQQVRNQLHASLECLNVVHSDHDQKQPQQSFTHHYQTQQPQVAYLHANNYPLGANQHYAASYVLQPASAETVINNNGDQDLAAAAMENPTQAYYRRATSVTSSYNGALTQAPAHNNYPSQSLFSRIQAPLWHSPLHRKISAQGQSIVSHGLPASSSNPMRAGHSSLSLASSSYLIEDKLQHEIKKLESELKIEKEKNEALNSQLSINSNLMAAFEQSLNTLNNRVRQLSTLNERKDKEIEELRDKLDSNHNICTSSPTAASDEKRQCESKESTTKLDKAVSENDNNSEHELHKVIEDLRRQLIEKDRLLTDTRLEALSAAHQLEQLESRLNRDQSIVVNDEDLDEGVLVVNHSPSDSEVVSDSAHFSGELTSQMSKVNEHQQGQHFYGRGEADALTHSDITLFGPNSRSVNNNTADSNNTSSLSNSNQSTHSPSEEYAEQQRLQFHYQTHPDDHSNHSSSDYHGGDEDDRSPADKSEQNNEPRMAGERKFDRYKDEDSEAMNRLLDIMLVSSN